MMPKIKQVRLSVVLSGALVLSGCSALSVFSLDAVDDNINYRKTQASVRALAIPPGLSAPEFNDTYAAAKTPQSAIPASMPSESTTLASSNSNAGVSSNRRSSSLGMALLEQSGSLASTPVASETVSAPKTVVVPQRTTAKPQVAMMRLQGGEPALAVNAPYAQTWRGLAAILAATGFQVSKQQPDQGIFTTTYQGKPMANLQQGGAYLVLVAENASQQSFIGIADAQGKPASEAVTNDALSLLKAEYGR